MITAASDILSSSDQRSSEKGIYMLLKFHRINKENVFKVYKKKKIKIKFYWTHI